MLRRWLGARGQAPAPTPGSAGAQSLGEGVTSGTALGFGWGFPWEIHLRDAYQADFITPLPVLSATSTSSNPPGQQDYGSAGGGTHRAAQVCTRGFLSWLPGPIQRWLLLSLPAPLPQEFTSAGLFLHGTSCSWTAAARALAHSPAAAFPLRVWHAEQGRSPPAPWRRAWCGEGSRCRTWWESFLKPRVAGLADDVVLLKLLLAWGLASQQPRPRRLPWAPRSLEEAADARLSAASSPVPTRLEQRQRRWEGVGSSEGPVLPVPDARGRVSCQRHHLLPGSSLGAGLPTPPQRDFRFPLLREPPPSTGSPAGGGRGSRWPLGARGSSPSALL